MAKIKLPVSTVAKLFKRAGAERVGKDAVADFAKILEIEAERIAKTSTALAHHDKRKTITAADVRLAKKNIS